MLGEDSEVEKRRENMKEDSETFSTGQKVAISPSLQALYLNL